MPVIYSLFHLVIFSFTFLRGTQNCFAFMASGTRHQGAYSTVYKNGSEHASAS